eukprot:Ihof_evm1s929 gene=Ihof_evmTU1s929
MSASCYSLFSHLSYESDVLPVPVNLQWCQRNFASLELKANSNLTPAQRHCCLRPI